MYSFIPLVYWRHHITCYFSLNIKSKYINFFLQTHQASEPMQLSLPSVSSSQPLSTQILALQRSLQCLLHRARLSLTTVSNIMGNLVVLTPIHCLFLVKHIQHLISIPWFVCLLYTSILQNVSFMRVQIPLIYSCLNPQPLASIPNLLPIAWFTIRFWGLFVFLIFYWSIVALQCCVHFCCAAKWISYSYTYILS